MDMAANTSVEAEAVLNVKSMALEPSSIRSEHLEAASHSVAAGTFLVDARFMGPTAPGC